MFDDTPAKYIIQYLTDEDIFTPDKPVELSPNTIDSFVPLNPLAFDLKLCNRSR